MTSTEIEGLITRMEETHRDLWKLKGGLKQGFFQVETTNGRTHYLVNDKDVGREALIKWVASTWINPSEN